MGDAPGSSTLESHMANVVQEYVEEFQQKLKQSKAHISEILNIVDECDLVVTSPEHVKSIAILKKQFGYNGSICIPADLDKKAKKAIRRKANKAGIAIVEFQTQKVTETCKGFLRPDIDWPSSAKIFQFIDMDLRPMNGDILKTHKKGK
ncbi:hypothetical protein RJ641_014183 [Dillenia turbinata]|uniref:Uncharacterized protein n=1 Tax=Dillenia turbinata TaxID=194707 RepID=A0AAN8Z285_9MAGN